MSSHLSISNHSPITTPIDEVRDTAFRRRIYVELSRMEGSLTSSTMRDEMTESLKVWQQQFKAAMRLRRLDARLIFDEFVLLLQELLRDPIYNAPLDKKAVLGSDGHTYGRMTLTVYLASIPEEERHRFPINRENPELSFITVPHPIVKEMVKWLEEHGKLLRDLEKENAYHELVAQGTCPTFPTRETELIRAIRDTALQRRRRRADRRDNLFRQLDALRVERDRVVQQVFENLQNQIEENHQSNQQRLANIQEEMIEQETRTIDQARQQLQQVNVQERLQTTTEENREDQVQLIDIDQERQRLHQVNNELQERLHELQTTMEENGEEQLAALQRREEERAQTREAQLGAFEERLSGIQITNHQQMQQELNEVRVQVQGDTQGMLRELDTIQSNDQRRGQEQQRNIDQLNNQIVNTETTADEVKKRQWKIEKEILKTENENLKLKIAIEETKQAIKKRNKGRGKALLIVAAGIAASGVATVGLQTLLSTTAPGTQGSVSLISGGAKITLSVGF